MRLALQIIPFLALVSFNASACSCSRAWNDSFSKTAKYVDLVALVKIISYDEYVESDIGFDDLQGKMPYAMTAEIVKTYKGDESIKMIKILGDDGMLCRPYLYKFKINSYYLVAPRPLENGEYDFFACWTDHLEVDISSNKAYGKYSLFQNEIDLASFENKMKVDWELIWIVLLSAILVLMGVVLKSNKHASEV